MSETPTYPDNEDGFILGRQGSRMRKINLITYNAGLVDALPVFFLQPHTFYEARSIPDPKDTADSSYAVSFNVMLEAVHTEAPTIELFGKTSLKLLLLSEDLQPLSDAEYLTVFNHEAWEIPLSYAPIYVPSTTQEPLRRIRRGYVVANTDTTLEDFHQSKRTRPHPLYPTHTDYF